MTREQVIAQLEAGNKDFSNQDLSNLDLVEFDFSHCNLTNTDFTNSYLTCASLYMSTIKGANFTNAALDGADLRVFKMANVIGVEMW